MLLKFVNAFSNKVNSGNPAAIYIVENFPHIEIMQRLSRKINLSETAFIKQHSLNNYYIRWFTPTSEASICIHATLASAHLLYENKQVNQNLKIKFINDKHIFTTSKTNDWINLKCSSIDIIPHQHNQIIDTILQKNSINFIGISKNILFVEFVHNYEVQKFIPKLNLIALLPYRALLITSTDDKYDFISRYFAPSVGINEDPVCGSAHCRLIPYWAQKLKKNSMIAYQASERGGIIKCKNLKNKVIISGKAILLKKEKIDY